MGGFDNVRNFRRLSITSGRRFVPLPNFCVLNPNERTRDWYHAAASSCYCSRTWDEMQGCWAETTGSWKLELRNQTIRYKPMRSVAVLLLGMQILAMPNAEAATSYRATVSFPGSIEAFSAALGLGSADPATVLLRTVRFIYGTPESSSQRGRQTLLNALAKPAAGGAERVPLPLTPQIWSDVILRTSVDEGNVVSAILKDRPASFLYYGLSALDDETLQWVATSRATLLAFRKHPEVFAAFGRSIRVHGGRVMVPGGPDAEPAWRSVINADPSSPAAFVERLISGD